MGVVDLWEIIIDEEIPPPDSIMEDEGTEIYYK